MPIKQYVMSDDELHAVQKVLLELLIEIDRICKTHNIIYSIDGGTLLGAVRHKGFIYWDDDADVIMTRSEYEKFVAACETELNTKSFYFQDHNNTKGYRWGYGKLRKNNTKFVRLNQEDMPYEQGIFVDIFPCDNVPDNYLVRAFCNFHSFIYRKIFWSVIAKDNTSGITKAIYTLLYKIPENQLYKHYNKYIKKRNKKRTKLVKCLAFPACNKVFGYDRRWYEETCDLVFENVVLQGSKDYDGYLKFLYGDYMVLPPIEKRKTHPISELVLMQKQKPDTCCQGKR